MNQVYKAMVFAGANLLALGANASDTTLLKPIFSGSTESGQNQAMSNAQMRATEAAHLEVYAGCKWGHAAFDPVKVESEELSPAVQSIYSELALA